MDTFVKAQPLQQMLAAETEWQISYEKNMFRYLVPFITNASERLLLSACETAKLSPTTTREDIPTSRVNITPMECGDSTDAWSSMHEGSQIGDTVPKFFEHESSDHTSSSQENVVVPEEYKTVPTYVIFAKQYNEDVFWVLIEHFFEFGQWPDVKLLPENLLNECVAAGLRPLDEVYLPGFAPLWMRYLRAMDYRVFKATVEYFFDEKKIVSWKTLPPTFMHTFEMMDLSEWDFPTK